MWKPATTSHQCDYNNNIRRKKKWKWWSKYNNNIVIDNMLPETLLDNGLRSPNNNTGIPRTRGSLCLSPVTGTSLVDNKRRSWCGTPSAQTQLIAARRYGELGHFKPRYVLFVLLECVCIVDWNKNVWLKDDEVLNLGTYLLCVISSIRKDHVYTLLVIVIS